jgi:hypothetical protein
MDPEQNHSNTPKGIINSLIQKYKDRKQKGLNKIEFHKSLMRAVEDGVLTQEEISNLNSRQSELGLTDEDINEFRVSAYVKAFETAKSDGIISEQEENELQQIQKYLGLTDQTISDNKKELSRFRLLAEIQRGNLPEINVSGLVTQKGEKVYWSEPAILAETKVVRRRYEGGSQGVSIRIMKGVSYRVGGHRGHLVSDTDTVPVSDGEFIITNKRLIFRGDGKSFAIKLDRILDLRVFTNGLNISEVNKTKPRMVAFKEEKNHDLVGAVLSQAINNFGAKEKK